MLSIGPQALGLASGTFFVVLIVVQWPIGALLDWIGPRRLVAGMILIGVTGSLMPSAAARSEASPITARALLDQGFAACF